MTHVLALIL